MGSITARASDPLRVGLTGSIGSGKSSVARLLGERGAVVIDADALARQATDDPAVLARVASELGENLLSRSESGSHSESGGAVLDRAATARLVFADAEARAKLNAIVHPWVAARRAEIEAEAAASGESAVIVNDIPLLFETGLEGEFDVVVVVTAPLAARAARVMARSGLSLEEFERRDGAQLPLEEKARRADLVVDNSGGPAELATEVARLWEVLTSRRRAT